MDQIKKNLKENTAILDPYASMIPVLVNVSAQADLNPGAILGLIGGVLLIILLLIQGWAILITSMTVLYPALHSIRAIESEDEDDDKVWLTYWMVFGVFNVIETFFGFIFWFIPYWGWIRPGFFVWLLLPNFNGAKVIYDSVLRPLCDQNKDKIEYYTKMFTTQISDAQGSLKKAGAAAVTDAMSNPDVLTAATKGMSQMKEMAKDDDEPHVQVAE